MIEFDGLDLKRRLTGEKVRPWHGVVDAGIMDAGWFEGAKLNFAAHILRHTGTEAAIVFCGEDGTRREVSRDALRDTVARVAVSLRASGVEKGDRVAGFLPNCPEAIIAMLATTSIGAIWSSCSPDFGTHGVVDRFGQIEPKVLFAANAYFYNGKICDSRDHPSRRVTGRSCACRGFPSGKRRREG